MQTLAHGHPFCFLRKYSAAIVYVYQGSLPFLMLEDFATVTAGRLQSFHDLRDLHASLAQLALLDESACVAHSM